MFELSMKDLRDKRSTAKQLLGQSVLAGIPYQPRWLVGEEPRWRRRGDCTLNRAESRGRGKYTERTRDARARRTVQSQAQTSSKFTKIEEKSLSISLPLKTNLLLFI